MELLDRVRRTVRRHRLAGPDDRVLAAVSGGSDSVALLHLLMQMQDAGELQLAAVAHFNHQLRPEADSDEQFCADLASSLGCRFIAGRSDVAAAARERRLSIEHAARLARHDFFERARVEAAASRIALGHTSDDQAETVLLRLLRGAGPAGLGGMHPRRGVLVRPLLDCRRAELRRYLVEKDIVFITDSSNDDVSVPRNRVRKELMPLLEERFNPSVTEVLADEAAMMRDIQAYLDSGLAEWNAQHRTQTTAEVRLSVAGLLEAPPALARLAVHTAMRTVTRGETVSFADVERVLELARNGGGPFDCIGQRVQRIGDEVVLINRRATKSGQKVPSEANLLGYSLSIPGEALLDDGRSVSAEAITGQSEWRRIGGNTAAVQVPSGCLPLTVRWRKAGDRFRPLGLDGWKKLQDFFVDEKVARGCRDAVPIVVDAADRIVWVAGYRIDDQFRVQDAAQTVIILRLKGGGGST